MSSWPQPRSRLSKPHFASTFQSPTGITLANSPVAKAKSRERLTVTEGGPYKGTEDHQADWEVSGEGRPVKETPRSRVTKLFLMIEWMVRPLRTPVGWATAAMRSSP